MESFVLFPWFIEHGEENVRPNDLVEMKLLFPYGKVFKVVGRTEGYEIISYKFKDFGVKPELLEQVGQVPFYFGDRVLTNGKISEIEDVLWHFKKREVYYLLSRGGKKSSRQYFAYEMQLL